MHLVLDLGAISPDLGTGCLWLGGEAASSNINLLNHNGIKVILPAAKKPAIAESIALKIYPCLDGTGVSQGDLVLEEVVEIIDQAIHDLLNGLSVLIHCHNGAHRSATLAAILLMRMCRKGAVETMNYITACRNIVDFNSYPPKRLGRVSSTRPADFLVSKEDEIQGEHREILVDFNDLQTPMMFRRKCLQLGFRTVAARPKAGPAQHFSLSSDVDQQTGPGGKKRSVEGVYMKPTPKSRPPILKDKGLDFSEDSDATAGLSGYGIVSDQGGGTSQYEMVSDGLGPDNSRGREGFSFESDNPYDETDDAPRLH